MFDEYNNGKRVERSKILPLLMMLSLLFLRFPLEIASSLNLISVPRDIIRNIYYEGTYLFSAILIWLERDRLLDFHIGLEAVVVFIITPIIKPIIYYLMIPVSPIRGMGPFYWSEIVIAVILGGALIFSHVKLNRKGIKSIFIWSMIAVIVGGLTAIGTGLLNRLQIDGPISTIYASFPLLIYLFITQLSNAAISEEPLFRGFLWGYLKKMNWKDHWIWLFQGVSFALAHIYYWGKDWYSFFIIVPVVGFVLGLLAWRSRSIAVSMIAHGLNNSLGNLITYYVWR